MIKIDARELRKTEMRLGAYKSKAPTVISQALNRVAANAKTNINRKTRETYVVKAKDVNQTMSIRKSNRGKLNAVITSKGGSMPLDKFKFSPKNPSPKSPQTLKVAVKKGGTKELLHAFVADINGSKIFERTGTARLPIQRLYGPAVPLMVGNVEVRRFVEQKAVALYKERLDHEIKRVIEGGSQ
jgi:hypothetical protein